MHGPANVMKAPQARQLGMSASFVNRIIPYLIVALSLLYFAITAGSQIAIPGLYYDEVLFVNAATGGVSDSFIEKRIGGIPVMLMPYIGALKAYLYFPIFKVFGVSPATIRFPVIVISLGSILLAYLISRFTFTEFESAMVVLIMAVDPVFIFMTKLDYGPIVLMMALKLLAVLFFLKLVTTLSIRYLFFLIGTCAFGLYDKLNFIWFMTAFGFAAVVLFGREFHELYKTHRLGLSLLISSFLALILYVGVVMIFPQVIRTQQSDVSVLERLSYISSLYAHTMNGTEFYSWVTDSQLPLGTMTNYLTAISLLMITIAGVFLFLCRTIELNKFQFADRVIGCYVILFVLIFVQIVLTHKAGGPHHIMMLYPFHHFLAIGVAVILSRAMNGDFQVNRSAIATAISKFIIEPRREWWSVQGRKLGFWFAIVVIVLLVGSEIRVGMNYAEAFAKGTLNPRWSPAIYEVADYVNRREVDAIVFIDWGIHNQVFALSGDNTRMKCFDLWPDFKGLDDPTFGTSIYDRFFRGKRVLALLHDPEAEVMPHSRQHFFAFAEYFLGGTKLERVFASVQGRPIFEAYDVDGRK
jgi:dolichyl-phosphate-mannose-protein mannosyltransferase